MCETPAPQPHRTRSPRAALAAVGLAGLLCAPLLPAPAANAHHAGGEITDITLDRTVASTEDSISITLKFSLPDTARSGDSFTLELPTQLRPQSTAGWQILSETGDVVADASWSGKTVTFTLGAFVEQHAAISGTGSFLSRWDRRVVGDRAGTYPLEFRGDTPGTTQPVTSTGRPETPIPADRQLSKYAGWSQPDEGSDAPAGALSWKLGLPTGPVPGPITLTDQAGPGWTIDCATLAFTTAAGLTSDRDLLDPIQLPAERILEQRCDPTGFTVVLSEITAGEWINLDYTGTITAPEQREFTNTAALRADTLEQGSEATATRTESSGRATGLLPVTVGDRVFLDTNNNGLQDSADRPLPGVRLVLDRTDGQVPRTINGASVEPVSTDGAGEYLFDQLTPLPSGTQYRVTVDTVASADALLGLVPSVSPEGSDPERDSAVGHALNRLDLTAGGVSDLSLDFGYRAATTVAPEPEPTPDKTPATPEPTPTGDPAPGGKHPAPPAKLAETGTDPGGPALLAALLLGLGTLLAARKRRTRA